MEDFYESLARDVSYTSFIEETFTDILHVRKIGCKTLIFNQVNFEHAITFFDIKRPDLIVQFVNCRFNGILLHASDFKSVKFSGCCAKTVMIRASNITTIQIESSQIELANFDNLTVREMRFSGNSNSQVKILTLTCGIFNVESNKENFILDLNYTVVPDTITGIERLAISSQSACSGRLSFNQVVVDDLFLIGRIDKLTVDFLDCEFNTIVIEELVNTGTLKFSSPIFKPASSIAIHKADMGKTAIFGVNFNQVNTFNISKANLNDLICAGVEWCNGISSKVGSQMSFAQLRETYKQIKNVNAKQNDKPEELKFYSLEMIAYSEELGLTKGHCGDKIILWFNNFTNRHGLSWTRPLGLIFGITIVCYPIIKMLLGYKSFDIYQTGVFFSEFFECINPIRKFNDSFGFPGTSQTGTNIAIAKILDIICLRLFNGLLIFQMIRAFRKYVK